MTGPAWWGQADLKEGFIRLRPQNCKTDEGRLAPLNREMVEVLKTVQRGLPGAGVLTRNGNPIKSIREVFEAACRRATIERFTFLDLRHTAIKN
jgi:integrase